MILDQAGPFWPAIPHQLEDRSKLNHPLLDAGMGQRGSTTTWPLPFFLVPFLTCKNMVDNHTLKLEGSKTPLVDSIFETTFGF